jgi:DNA-binding HxlR family transcriptional regulator
MHFFDRYSRKGKYKMTSKERYMMCPVDAAIALMSGKWKPRILWKLHLYKVLRYSEFQREMPSITHKMLAQQLRELESDGLITRTMYAVMPPKVEYRLSDFGQTLAPVIDSLATWSRAHEAEVRAVLERKELANPA